MAETQTSTQSPTTGNTSPPNRENSAGKGPQKRGPSIHEIYALPAPIRTFPLPVFYPNNPVSLFHIAYAWLSQVFKPPPTQPAIVYNGIWSQTTTSINITDERSMRALWEQGFYGKGNLSRSEPNWLKREQVRRGLENAHVSEILTVQRREERQQAKWERARLEQEAIRQTRLEETRLAESRLAKLLPQAPVPPIVRPPVGPLEILALPNSDSKPELFPQTSLPRVVRPPVGPLEILALPNSGSESGLLALSGPFGPRSAESVVTNGLINGHSPSGSTLAESLPGIDAAPAPTNDSPFSIGEADFKAEFTTGNEADFDDSIVNGQPAHASSQADPSPILSSNGAETKTLKRQKSVRFSPNIESTTFQLSDPPSPSLSLAASKVTKPATTNGTGTTNVPISTPSNVQSDGQSDGVTPPVEIIANKEHLQLTSEEAFFLAFGLGVLTITDPLSGRVFSLTELFTLFRQHSYFPPRVGPFEPALQPDDSFLVNYAVYHHFRSLGWVPRAGIKFGVDWLLYTRGPVFDHAEFGLILIPSYSDPWWKEAGKQGPRKSWYWLHNIIRVLSHVMKSLVLVYVEVPPLPKFDEALETGLTDALKLYNIREVTVKRWSSNRNR